MARTELPNGVILPAEYSDDWFEDMTSNLTKLDDVIGSDSEKLNADGVDFLRMSSAALTNGGTGNFSDLNSSYKIKTGDLVLDSGRKLYQVVSVDSMNETFTVGNSFFKVTAESDLAPVAESGDYDDLDNKPDLKPVATSGDYDDLDNKPDLKPVATSGDYDDLTDLPTYGITRYCAVAITDNSSLAFSNISSTDKIKVGDFLLDTTGKIYQISAVDTSTETVSVTTPLTQLAVDSGVVHKSGDETVGGLKTFANNRMVVGRNTDGNSAIQLVNSDVIGDSANGASSFEVYGSSISDANKIGNITIGEFSNNTGSYAKIECNRTVSGVKSSNAIRSLIRPNGAKELSATVDNDCKLGTEFLRWSKIYGTEYYYGSNNVEFSTKFVTTDTAQTISGAKTFSDDLTIYNSETTAYAKYLNLKNQRVTRGSSETGGQGIQYQDKSNKTLTMLEARVVSNGNTSFNIVSYNIDGNNQVVFDGVSVIKSPTATNFAPTTDNAVTCGRSLSKWSDVQTYKVNNLEPSSLFMPADRGSRIDISGYFTNTGSGYTNEYNVIANGYIFLNLLAVNYVMCYSLDGSSITNYAQSFSRMNDGQLYVFFPVRKGDKFRSIWYSTGGTVSVTAAYFIPCQGNI